MERAPYHERSRPLLLLAFGTIIAVLVLGSIATLHRHKRVLAEVHSIVGDALASVRLVDRMYEDVERQHLFLEEHVRVTVRDDLPNIERRLDRAYADFEEAARAYEPLASYEGEREIWNRLRGHVASIQERLPTLLELSRTDPGAAFERLGELEGLYAAVERDTKALAEINTREATAAEARVDSLQRSLGKLIVLLGVVCVGVTLVVGLVVSRLIRRREDRIADYASDLELRNRDLDAFAGRVAHDLRGPLTTIDMAAATMTKRHPEEETTAGLLRRGVARMEGLIKDLLSLARIDAYSGVGRCDPSTVATQLAEELRPRLDAEGARLQVDVPPAQVRIGEGLLRQALWNLADNALRYRRPEEPPRIDIQGDLSGGSYELRISDNGAGMSPDDILHAFEPFYRGETAQKQSGTGLGLSIVKRVLEANGGTASVRSQPGHGTTFSLRLPLLA